MTANDYIEADNNLETEEVTVDEAAIIEEICYQTTGLHKICERPRPTSITKLVKMNLTK
ncbi:4516_t:CDS:2 [Cetraspora pellucida]|uniref:4516_t:CDS:1 n=1 Tax=Cetraspora pellucida TaxID=1433469 RepID=A0ACA9LBH9_9GLOM|nr:4516_t:CDS:2 [Cetraspora pellucida]